MEENINPASQHAITQPEEVIFGVLTDTSPPALSYADGLGSYVDLYFIETGSPPLLPATGNIPGFSVSFAGVDVGVVTAARKGSSAPNWLVVRLTLPGGHTITEGQVDVTVSYAPATPALTDNAGTPNAVLAFSNKLVNTDHTGPVVSSITGLGTKITVVFSDLTAPLLPATGNIPGFTVTIAGITYTPLSANLAGSSSSDWLSITLLLPVTATLVEGTSGVTVSYTPGSPALTDSSPLLNTVLAFSNHAVLINSDPENVAPPYFDPEIWLRKSVPSLAVGLAEIPADPPVGDLYERRIGYPMAGVLVDTQPPVGGVILNEDAGGGGLNVHHFLLLDSSKNSITGTMIVQDALDTTMRVASTLGGATNESAYETVGVGGARCLTILLTSVADVYPLVSSIEVGITAITPKDYLLEVQLTPDSAWLPLESMQASFVTREYFTYTFTAAQNLSGARIHYRGDYYAPAQTGTVSLAAYDVLDSVVAAQVSHYSDFRDAVDFPNTDGYGWLPFTEGMSLFPWNFINVNRLYASLPNTASTALNGVIPYGTQYVAWTDAVIYLLDPVAGLTLAFDTTSNGATTGATVNCAAVFQGAVYVGLSNGILLYSTSGTGYTLVNATSALPPIYALKPFAGQLYIGTGPDVTGAGVIYAYTGSIIRKMRSLTQPTSLNVRVTALEVVGSYLFAAVGGLTGEGAGGVFAFSGSAWTLSFTTTADSVDVLRLATLDGRLWAGLAGGKTYALTFTSGTPQTWAKDYASDATHYTDIVDDPNGNFLFFPNDKRLAVATRDGSSGLLAFTAVPWIAPNASVPVNDLAYNGNWVVAGNDGKAYILDTSSLLTLWRQVYVRYKDSVGNVTATPFATDDILQDVARDSTGQKISNGLIYQVPRNLVSPVTFASNLQEPLYAPDRILQQSGIYENEPYYVPTLSRWDLITYLVSLPAGSGAPVAGLQSGTQISVYARSADTRELCLAADWSLATVTGNIVSPTTTGAYTGTVDISTQPGKWLQYKVVLTSASRSYTPHLQSVVLSYHAANASYFFTSMFDLTDTGIVNMDGVHESAPTPVIRRGLLTADHAPNGGYIVYGYTTDATVGNTYDFSRYQVITPNTVFELPQAASQIRFGILLMSLSSITPAVVDDFAVLLDIGTSNLKIVY